MILRDLSHLGDLNGIKDAATEHVIEDDAHEGLESSGGRQAGTAKNVAGAVDVDALHFIAALDGERRHTADQCESGLFFGFYGFKNGEISLDHAVALRIEADHICSVESRRGDGVEVDACSQYAAVLVVSVVAADLSAAGSGVKSDFRLRVLRECDLESPDNLSKSVCVVLRLLGLTTVNFDHATVQGATFQFFEKCICAFHISVSASCILAKKWFNHSIWCLYFLV